MSPENLNRAPRRTDFPDDETGRFDYVQAYALYVAVQSGLDMDDRIITTLTACMNNPERWNKGSDRARGG